MQVCGPGEYFKPDGQNGGVCTSAGGRLESSACVTCRGKNAQSAACVDKTLPVAPVAAPQRHPIVAMFLAQNQPLPSHLEAYNNIKY